MSKATTTPAIPSDAIATRLRNTIIGALFALVLLVPKLLQIHRNKRTWLLFRMALGLTGAALVVLPLGLWNSWTAAIAGLAMFLAAALLPPAKTDTSADHKARELGALIVVNGGDYQPGNAPTAHVQLFVGSENVWALDPLFQPLLVIPTSEISSARAEQAQDLWLLSVRWSDHTAEFSFRGIFAEHLARVAESTLRGVMHPALPVIPQRRAASA